jgi:hypothetical protein
MATLPARQDKSSKTPFAKRRKELELRIEDRRGKKVENQ